MSEKLDLTDIISKIDNRNKNYWNELSEDQRKELKRSFFVLNRYVSNVSPPKAEWKDYYRNKFKIPSRDEQEYFVLVVNEYFNKDWSLLQNHPELLWKLLCLCGYSVKNKKFFHEWIPLKKTTSNTKKSKFLLELYPTKKLVDIELLSKLITDAELIELAKSYGLDDSTIAKKLK